MILGDRRPDLAVGRCTIMDTQMTSWYKPMNRVPRVKEKERTTDDRNGSGSVEGRSSVGRR